MTVKVWNKVWNANIHYCEQEALLSQRKHVTLLVSKILELQKD